MISLYGESYIEEWVEKETKIVKEILSCSPFRSLPNALISFLMFEKTRLSLNEESRQIFDSSGNLLGGFTNDYKIPDDIYHPEKLSPFEIKGYWIPLDEGQIFGIDSDSDKMVHSLIRTRNRQQEVLFFIHPKAEKLFQPLIGKYHHNQVIVSAISLSSSRTLLVALPLEPENENTRYHFTIVKVSLPEEISGVLRCVKEKECACSVATNLILNKRNVPIFLMQEDMAFVPKKSLMAPEFAPVVDSGAGMIHRVIPDILTTDHPHRFIMPFYALFGRKNSYFIDILLKQAKLTPTDFFEKKLLRPLAKLLVELIYFKKASFEFHGQNLLLIVNTHTSQGIHIDFLFRDIGSVNIIIQEDEKSSLPNNLRNDSFFYSKNHVIDSALCVEKFVKTALFNFTKSCFKSDAMTSFDAGFISWKDEMIKRGYANNWTIFGRDDESHEVRQTPESMYTYGYFEKIFGRLFFEELEKRGILNEAKKILPERNYAEFFGLLEDPQDVFSPSNLRQWFFVLVYETVFSTCNISLRE